MTKIVADCCANHMGDRRIMEAMIKTLSEIGVDIVKFQSWQADKLIKTWPDYDNAYVYYKQHELSDADHYWIIDKCKQYRIEPLFTVFDLDRVDFLAEIGMKKVKIASPDANSWALIEKCLKKFDEVLISTGMHTEKEIEELVDKFFTSISFMGKERNVILLQCTSKYPAQLHELGIKRMEIRPDCFYSFKGYSDHTLGTDASKLAIALGAKYVEKHFTLSRNLPGKDQAISGTIEEFTELVQWRDKVAIMISPVEDMPDREARKYISKWGDNR